MVKRVKNGDLITVDYVGTINKDEIFETTQDTGPLDFKVGDGSVFAAFEQAVLEMAENDTKTISIKPVDAYGEHMPELIHTVDQKTLSIENPPSPGMVFGMTIEHEGKPQKVPALVTKVENGKVTVDFNHPLAGKTLTYDIKVTAIGSTAI